MLEVKELVKEFKVDFWDQPFKALEKLSFKINENEVVGFLGANGAGKTTTLKIIMDFIRPTSGNVVFDKRFGKTRTDIAKKIGYLPERPFFYPHLTGREFLHYMGKLAELNEVQIVNAIGIWSEKFKVDFALDRKVRTYSKGMLQRVGFASALLHGPEFIILDEPLSGLDPIGRKELKEVILQLKSMGKTVFFSSHIVSDVEEVCEKVIFIEKGQMVYQGSIDKLIHDSVKPISFIKVRGEMMSVSAGVELFIDEKNFKVYKVNSQSKNDFIKETLEKGGEIEEIKQDKLTLEEIFYTARDLSKI